MQQIIGQRIDSPQGLVTDTHYLNCTWAALSAGRSAP